MQRILEHDKLWNGARGELAKFPTPVCPLTDLSGKSGS